MGQYIGQLGMKIVSNPLTFAGGMVSVASNLFSFAMGAVNEYKNNPFKEAERNSEITGRYLAEILIRCFSDRFVNLVGFSLGT